MKFLVSTSHYTLLIWLKKTTPWKPWTCFVDTVLQLIHRWLTTCYLITCSTLSNVRGPSHIRHMWVEFVVGSPLAPERFFSRYSGFPLSSKTNISKFQFDQEEGRRRTTMWMSYLQIIIYLFICLYTRDPERLCKQIPRSAFFKRRPRSSGIILYVRHCSTQERTFWGIPELQSVN